MILPQNLSDNKRAIVMAEKSKILLLIFLSFFWSSGISAQDLIMKKSTDSGVEEYILEEITVIGQSLHSLRMEMVEAEDVKFEIFNSLNSTDDFDIYCEYVAHTQYNSRIKRRECNARYMKNAQSRATYSYLDDFLSEGKPLPSDYQIAMENAPKTEDLNKEMVELGIKHPSLARAMINQIELEQRYTVEWRERFKDSILVGHAKPEEYFRDELKFLDFAYSAYLDRMMEEEIWDYWDRRLRSVILQEPYRSIWLSSNSENFADIFIAYVNGILWE